MKPTPAEMLKFSPRSQSASTPPIAPSGTDRKISDPEPDRVERGVEQQEDQGQGQRHDDRQPLRGRLQVLERPAPLQV